MSSCGAIKSGAVKSVANMLSESGTTITSHDDPDLVADALPFSLLLNESLLASVPKHEGLLTATCGQYTQYAVGFIQADAEAAQFDDYERSKSLSNRALKLALRGRGYCWRALEVRFPGVSARLVKDSATAVPRARKQDVPLLYWSAASLGSAISSGGLDRPELLINWPVVRALAERGARPGRGLEPRGPARVDDHGRKPGRRPGRIRGARPRPLRPRRRDPEGPVTRPVHGPGARHLQEQTGSRRVREAPPAGPGDRP